MARDCRVLLIGFGNVGRRLCELLSEEISFHPQLKRLRIRCIGIFTARHGAWVDAEGIDLAKVLRLYRRHSRLPLDHPSATKLSVAEAVAELDYDVLIELTTLSIERRGEPALSYIKQALRRGLHVVTANKGPAAFALSELREMAQRGACRFRFESTVLDGFPVFNLQRHGLSASRCLRLEGILNCTSNFVLASALENGELEGAIREAQRKGFAEADPKLDLLGWDAAAKITILANTLLLANLTPLDVARDELSPWLIEKLAKVKRPGDCWRLVAQASLQGGEVEAQVELMNLPLDHPFRTLSPSSGGLLIETDLTGRLFFAQRDPDLTDTAYGVIQDLWDLRGGSGA